MWPRPTNDWHSGTRPIRTAICRTPSRSCWPWDAILRGLVHWDSLDPRPPLDIVAALPVATQRVPWWQITLRRWLWRHHSAYYAARRAIDRLVGWLPFLERFKPRA